MGLIGSKLNPILQEWCLNYSPDKLNIGLFSGKFSLGDQHLNYPKINQKLADAGMPLKMKFGMMTNIKMSLSYFKLQLELFEIDDLIVVLGPEADNVKWERGDYSPEEKEAHITHMMENYRRLQAGQALKENPIIAKEEAARKKKEEEQAKKNPQVDDNASKADGPNILGPELFELITGRLEFKIKIKNLRIYYEDNETMHQKDGGCLSFSLGLVLNDLVVQNDDIANYIQPNGDFKNLLNVTQFKETLYEAHATSQLYYILALRYFGFEFYIGKDQILPKDLMSDGTGDLKQDYYKGINTKEFVKYFYEVSERRRGNNYKIFQTNDFSTDIILGYNNAEANPINALILNMNLKNIGSAIELVAINTFLEITSYFESTHQIKIIQNLKPPLRPQPRAYRNQIANKLGLSHVAREELDKLAYMIVMEHFKLQLWLQLYENYKHLAGNEDTKIRIEDEYWKESVITQCFYGKNYFEENRPKKKEVKEEPKKEGSPPTTEAEKGPVKPKDIISTIQNLVGKVHFQVRATISATIDIFKDDQKDIQIELHGLTLSIMKPPGPLRANVQLLLKYIRINFFTLKQISNTDERKKKKIFGGTNDQMASSPQKNLRASPRLGASTAPMMVDHRTTNVWSQLEYNKLHITINLKTHKTFDNRLLPMISQEGRTGDMTVKAGIQVFDKIKNLLQLMTPTRKRAFERKNRNMKNALKIKIRSMLQNDQAKKFGLNKIAGKYDSDQIEKDFQKGLQNIGSSSTKDIKTKIEAEKWHALQVIFL